MADFGSTVKNIWMKGMEAIGNTATNIANNTKYKVDEMNMVNRRTEILADFGSKAYALWLKGERFPAELEEQLTELKNLDEKLNDMRAERYAGVKTEAHAEPEGKPEEEEAPEKEEEAEEALSEEAEETLAEPESGADEREDCAEAPEEAKPESAEPEEPTKESEPEAVPEEGVPVIKVEKPADEAPENEAVPLSSAINDLFEKIPSREEMETKVNSALDSLSEGLVKFSKQIDEGLSNLTDKMNNDKE